MKLSELIVKVQNMRPCEYDKADLTQWVNEIEFTAVEEVFDRAEGSTIAFKPYDYEVDGEATLLIPDQFSGVYTSYLFAKIDMHNAEVERSNLDTAMFDAEWKAFSSWYRRHNRPKRVYGKERKHEATVS